jgi:arginase
MKVRIFHVPYDSGYRNERMGRGPEHLLRHGAVEELRRGGHEVALETIESGLPFRTEGRTAFELCRSLAGRVRDACSQAEAPLVLSGNCISSLGALAGLGPEPLGLIWFDAHGDYNTPETTLSGYLDGMSMSVAAGLCWSRLAAGIPGFRPVPEPWILHVGGRDFDAEEEKLLHASGVQVVPASEFQRGDVNDVLGPALEELRARVRRVYVHVDLDVLDPQEAPANEYGVAVPGGLRVAQVEEALDRIRERLEVCGGALAAYDPAYDPEGLALRAGLRVLGRIFPAGRPARDRGTSVS